jgi:hypothetical protein
MVLFRLKIYFHPILAPLFPLFIKVDLQREQGIGMAWIHKKLQVEDLYTGIIIRGW